MDITGIVTLAGGAVADTVTAALIAVDNKVGTTDIANVASTLSAAVGNTALTSVLGGSTPTTISGALAATSTAIGNTDISAIVNAAGGAVADTLSATIIAVDGKAGDLTTLTTTAKSTFVAAINEIDTNADTAATTANTVSTLVGSVDITGIVTLAGGAVADTVTAALIAVDNKAGTTAIANVASTLSAAIGNTALTGVTPLGASAPTTLSGGLGTLTNAIGTSALTTVGLRGASTAVPSTIKVAVDNINAALGNGQLLENSAGAGTISGVIGTIATGLLGSGSTTIAAAIGNSAIFAPALSAAIGNTDISTIVTAAGADAGDSLSSTILAVDNKFGALTALSTSATSTIVGAINEINANNWVVTAKIADNAVTGDKAGVTAKAAYVSTDAYAVGACNVADTFISHTNMFRAVAQMSAICGKTCLETEIDACLDNYFTFV